VRLSFDPFSFVVLAVAGWMSRHQQEVIAYLVEENRVLREQMGNPRLKFNDDQRRRLAAKAKKLLQRLPNSCGSGRAHSRTASKGYAIFESQFLSVAAALSRTLSDANGGVKIGGAVTNEATVSVRRYCWDRLGF